MPKPKVLSGKEVISIFKSFDFLIVSQKGSHLKLERIIGEKKQILIVPNHKDLDIGTVKSIYKKALLYLSEKELRAHFYSDNS